MHVYFPTVESKAAKFIQEVEEAKAKRIEHKNHSRAVHDRVIVESDPLDYLSSSDRAKEITEEFFGQVKEYETANNLKLEIRQVQVEGNPIRKNNSLVTKMVASYAVQESLEEYYERIIKECERLYSNSYPTEEELEEYLLMKFAKRNTSRDRKLNASMSRIEIVQQVEKQE